MKVLHVLNELKFSGAEVMLKTASKYWKSWGVKSDIMTKGNNRGRYGSILEEAGYNVIHIPDLNTFTLLSEFSSLISKKDYDVVHIHTEDLNFLIGFVATVKRVPVIIRTVHNAFLHGGNTRFKRVVQRALLRSMGVVHISISRTVENTENNFLYNPTKCIWNWYDSEAFVPPSSSERSKARKDFDVTRDEFVITSVGNCSERKNHSSILRALAYLEYPKIKYLHAGEEREERSERKLATDLGIRDQVQFLGPVEDVVSLLYASDVFIMPSLREGFGIAASEAMGSGLICVLSEVPGLCDHKDFDGVFMTRPQPAAISNAIERVRDIPEEERLQLGRELSKQAKKRYGIREGARQYAELYKQELT